MGLRGDQIVIVSDIGCSGLFDTFFHTHALHGLHGRALTYATGIKLARPELTVVVTMGDGGIGIGGAHFLSACRRNIDLTLLVLNNFNFGMTGGQYSATTPPDAETGSGFLNKLERPLDIAEVACSAGATYVTRCSSFRKDLAEEIERAIRHKGFSVLDIWGMCTGRYTKKNNLNPQIISERLASLPPIEGIVEANMRKEYGAHYRGLAGAQKPISPPEKVDKNFNPPQLGRQDVILLGNAGQRVISAGDLLCYAGLAAGMRVTQKNEYNITVLTGPSISEVILSPEQIGFTGITRPSVVVALGQEGVERRADLFDSLDDRTLLIQIKGVEVPANRANVHHIDFKGQGIKRQDWALASLAVLAKFNRVINLEMLQAAIEIKFRGSIRASALKFIDQVNV